MGAAADRAGQSRGAPRPLCTPHDPPDGPSRGRRAIHRVPGDPGGSRNGGGPTSSSTRTPASWRPASGLSPATPATPRKPPADPQLVLPGDDGPQPDPISEDASILLETAAGPVLILGCAHGGVLNILDHLAGRLGGFQAARRPGRHASHVLSARKDPGGHRPAGGLRGGPRGRLALHPERMRP